MHKLKQKKQSTKSKKLSKFNINPKRNRQPTVSNDYADFKPFNPNYDSIDDLEYQIKRAWFHYIVKKADIDGYVRAMRIIIQNMQ